MSGIAGLLRFDNRPVTRHELERAANVLRRYGPDRSDIMANGSIGLVHALMRMTPEDRFDRQPLRGASGALITADLRLDNRDDILAGIGIARQDAAEWPDARVLLAAWEKFGDGIWPMLHGPFAAAIWQPESRTLTLARDQLGLNVVMWHRSDKFFAFATMPNGLFALADVPRELSEEKFADFLVLNHADHETTIYRNVFRVAPAHVLHIKPDGSISRRRYWSPANIKSVRLPSDEAYAEGLRDTLDRAVRRQMRSIHPIGSLLSGGLDSSSVSVLAARALAEKNERLAAFTGVPRRGFDGVVPNGAYADETPYVDAIQRTVPTIDVSYVRNDEYNDFASWTVFFIALDGRCAIRPISAGSWACCEWRARKAAVFCSGGFPATAPSAGAAGRRRLVTSSAGGCSQRRASGVTFIAARRIRAGWRCASSSSSRWRRAVSAIGRNAAVVPTASPPARSRRHPPRFRRRDRRRRPRQKSRT